MTPSIKPDLLALTTMHPPNIITPNSHVQRNHHHLPTNTPHSKPLPHSWLESPVARWNEENRHTERRRERRREGGKGEEEGKKKEEEGEEKKNVLRQEEEAQFFM